jgi:hypothetical protein
MDNVRLILAGVACVLVSACASTKIHDRPKDGLPTNSKTLSQLVDQLQPLIAKQLELDSDAAAIQAGGSLEPSQDEAAARAFIFKTVPSVFPVEVFETSNRIAIRCKFPSCTEHPTPEQLKYHDQLVAQADDPKMKDYVRQVCALPQPARAQKGSELYDSNRVLAACAFDNEHPEPKINGPLVVMRLDSDLPSANAP